MVTIKLWYSPSNYTKKANSMHKSGMKSIKVYWSNNIALKIDFYNKNPWLTSKTGLELLFFVPTSHMTWPESLFSCVCVCYYKFYYYYSYSTLIYIIFSFIVVTWYMFSFFSYTFITLWMQLFIVLIHFLLIGLMSKKIVRLNVRWRWIFYGYGL